MDNALLRKKMVQEQLIPRGIKDKKVLGAFSKVERQRFVPKGAKENAYSDFPLPIGNGQTISQPYIAALMTQCLGLRGNEKVLEIGTGSGYQTAILAELGHEVYSIERFEALAKNAENILRETGYTNVHIKVGDGTLGWPEAGPFDRIIVTAAASCIPEPLTEQLQDGGKLVMPLGESFSQILTTIEKKQGRIQTQDICGCVFVPLIGKFSSRDGS